MQVRLDIKISEIAKKYSIDENLWGRAIEGGLLENLENEPLVIHLNTFITTIPLLNI